MTSRARARRIDRMTATQSKVAVVTGATSGLGEAAALALAARGWRVVVVGRDAERGRAVIARYPDRMELETADLFSLRDVAALAARLRARFERIDVLINNAGATFPRTERTVDGLERTFALNVAAPYVLTSELLGALAGGRVVNVVTGIPRGARTTVQALAGADAKGGMGVYVANKLALLALTRELSARHRDISFVALHPGVILETRFSDNMPMSGIFKPLGLVARMFGLTSTLEQASARYVEMASAPQLESGGYYWEGRLAPAPTLAGDPAFQKELHERLASLAPERAKRSPGVDEAAAARR